PEDDAPIPPPPSLEAAPPEAPVDPPEYPGSPPTAGLPPDPTPFEADGVHAVTHQTQINEKARMLNDYATWFLTNPCCVGDFLQEESSESSLSSPCALLIGSLFRGL